MARISNTGAKGVGIVVNSSRNFATTLKQFDDPEELEMEISFAPEITDEATAYEARISAALKKVGIDDLVRDY